MQLLSGLPRYMKLHTGYGAIPSTSAGVEPTKRFYHPLSPHQDRSPSQREPERCISASLEGYSTDHLLIR